MFNFFLTRDKTKDIDFDKLTLQAFSSIINHRTSLLQYRKMQLNDILERETELLSKISTLGFELLKSVCVILIHGCTHLENCQLGVYRLSLMLPNASLSASTENFATLNINLEEIKNFLSTHLLCFFTEEKCDQYEAEGISTDGLGIIPQEVMLSRLVNLLLQEPTEEILTPPKWFIERKAKHEVNVLYVENFFKDLTHLVNPDLPPEFGRYQLTFGEFFTEPSSTPASTSETVTARSQADLPEQKTTGIYFGIFDRALRSQPKKVNFLATFYPARETKASETSTTTVVEENSNASSPTL